MFSNYENEKKYQAAIDYTHTHTHIQRDLSFIFVYIKIIVNTNDAIMVTNRSKLLNKVFDLKGIILGPIIFLLTSIHLKTGLVK